MDITILGIESSCDDTSAAVIQNTTLLSNVIASQAVHVKYGGVIPELASRAHQQNIIPVVDTALKEAGITVDKIDAIAFTRGPGLLGSLLVGTSFAKGLSIAGNIPMVEVNHLQGHILSHFIDLPDRDMPHPAFPFLCLLVSGGHTQIVKVSSPLEMEIIGTTIDDAAGEAFDKCAKVRSEKRWETAGKEPVLGSGLIVCPYCGCHYVKSGINYRCGKGKNGGCENDITIRTEIFEKLLWKVAVVFHTDYLLEYNSIKREEYREKIGVLDKKIEVIKDKISKVEEKKDRVLLAGKGHEDYQEIKGVKYPMDESVLIQEILEGK